MDRKNRRKSVVDGFIRARQKCLENGVYFKGGRVDDNLIKIISDTNMKVEDPIENPIDGAYGVYEFEGYEYCGVQIDTIDDDMSGDRGLVFENNYCKSCSCKTSFYNEDENEYYCPICGESVTEEPVVISQEAFSHRSQEKRVESEPVAMFLLFCMILSLVIYSGSLLSATIIG